MKLSDFDIELSKISKERLELNYQLSSTFFALKENSLYSDGKISVDIGCDKYDSSINFHVALEGVIDFDCERCLEPIQLPVKTNFLHVLKQSAELELLQNENYISVDANKYNIYDVLYENICLCMPLRKICANSLKNKECKNEYLESVTEQKDENSIWNELKKLKL